MHPGRFRPQRGQRRQHQVIAGIDQCMIGQQGALHRLGQRRCQHYRPVGRYNPGAGQQGTRDHRIGHRQRQRMRAQCLDQRRDLAQRQPCTARTFGHQGVEIAGFNQALPQGVDRPACFERAHRVERRHGIECTHERIDQIAVHPAHRKPIPRAIIPRRISRVPPRSEKLGATCVT